MPRRSHVLGLVGAATVFGLGVWLLASSVRGTNAPPHPTVPNERRPATPHGSNSRPTAVEPGPTEPLRRQASDRPASDPATLQDANTAPADQALLDELMALQILEPVRVYELVRQRFANAPDESARLVQLAVAEVVGNDILEPTPFLAAVFAAWLDASRSPHAVLTATLAMVPSDSWDLTGGPLTLIAEALAKRHDGLPPQPDGQQSSLVHALITAAEQHRNRRSTGVLVARALVAAAEHDQTAQAALVRLARSTESEVQEIAWAGLAAELTPSALLPVIDEPLPPEPGDHDAERVRAALASIRNAPEQRDVIDRWLGARLLDLARQCETSTDPNRHGARWLTVVREYLSEDDRKALIPELQTLAAGRGHVARFARHLLQTR